MARPLRVEYPGAWYHVMNRGRHRKDIFETKADFHTFIKLLSESNKLFGLKVHAYVMMSNHYHLLLSTPHGNLSRIMRHINGVYTQKYNNCRGLDGSIFKGRYKSILVESELYAKALIRYIHLNPIKAGLEQNIGDYKWSSHNSYCKPAQSPSFLFTDDILLMFDRYENRAITELNKFTLSNYETETEIDKILKAKKWPAMLGSDMFKDRIKKIYLDNDLLENRIADKRIATTSTIKDIFDQLLVSSSLNLDKYNQMNKKMVKPINSALVYLCCSELFMTYREIGEFLNGLSTSSVGLLYNLAKTDIENNGKIFQLIKNWKLGA